MQTSVHAVEALWIFHPVIEIPLAGIMYRRKLHRQFPVFFAYILFQVVGFAILFPLYRSRSSTDYFFAYWIDAIACWVFGFKVIHEIFSDVFRPFPALKDMGTVLFRWAALVTPLLMFVILASSSSGSDTLPRDGLIGTERRVRFIQCALILISFTVLQLPGGILAKAKHRYCARLRLVCRSGTFRLYVLLRRRNQSRRRVT